MSLPQSPGFLESFAQEFMPHRVCYLSNPLLIWSHFLTDLLIGLAYVGISLTLYALVKRIRLPFSPMILSFGTFIGACGLTHFMEVYTLWNPSYWLSAFVKAVTALASVTTGLYLLRIKPQIVAVANSASLSEERRVRLETTNAELQGLYEQVKSLSEARSRFFTNVSHELRTPLTLILGPVEKLLREGDASASVRRELELVSRNAQGLLHQVNSLLDAAKLEADSVTPHFRRTPLGSLVRITATHFETLAQDRKVHLNIEAPDGMEADVDPDLLQQVLVNLVSNAFKYVPEHGRVGVKLTHGPETVRITVTDNGPGVPLMWRTKIFERFQQVEDTVHQRGGTGLGLAIAKDIVSLHDGLLWVEDAPGGGACFIVEFPRARITASPFPAQGVVDLRVDPALAVASLKQAPAHAPEAALWPAAWTQGDQRPTVLVVEDNPDMRDFIAGALSSMAQVVTAADGRDGWVRAESLRPDVIVTDLMMPYMTGEALFFALREKEALKDIPVLLLTAKADDELKVKLLAAGAFDYLGKPFSSEELRARVGNAALLKRTRDALSEQVAQSGNQVDVLARELVVRHRELSATVEAVHRARAEAEVASEAKSTFLSLVSHELRTPLTSIRLALNLMSKGDPPSTAVLSRADRSYQRLFGLIESLLEYTSIEAGGVRVAREPVDLTHIALEMVDDLLPQAQQKLLRLTFVRPEAPMTAVTDAKLVRLVLMNLIANAIKFTVQGEVEVSLSASDSSHRLSVRDTGPGIPADRLQELFEPFRQLEPMNHKSAPGVGLGLALVKEMSRALGGKVDVTSRPGEGSTFTLVLPLLAAAER